MAGDTAIELATLIQVVVQKIPLWIAAFIVMILAVVIAKIGRSIIENKLAEKGIEEEHKELQILGGRVTYTGILMLGITVALKIAGIDLTSILAAVAFGIGFALKDMIMNFLAGILILIGRHFTLGDFISVGGTLGKVVEIQSRVTILKAIDGTKVIVPNADLFKKQVISFTSNPFRRIEVAVGVEYRSDLENVLKVCMKAIKTTEGVLVEPKPAVLISDFGDSAITIKLKAWVDSKGGWIKIKSNLVLNVKKLFDEHNITIPWPIRTSVQDKDQDYTEKPLVEPVATEEEVAPPVPEAPVQPGATTTAAQVATPAAPATPAVTPQVTAQAQVAAQPVPVPTADAQDQGLKPLNEQR